MISQTLREARQYEEAMEKLIAKEEKPEFHLSSRVGWMNDPNGFSYYQGKYHMFYQYYPYAPVWGPMHWAHAVSEDLLHWDYLPAAMAPDTFYDKDGVFSGSALVLEDGRHLLMYTGVLNGHDASGVYYSLQRQCLAVGDGIDYKKYEGNPVLDGKDIPEGSSTVDFRDPKMWRDPDGTYYCVTGNRPADGSGQILLYESQDAFHWTFKKVLIENKGRYGMMWECPDFFELDGKYVLLTSPQDMLPEGFEYHNGDGTLVVVGNCDKGKYEFEEETFHSIDYGIDFYAPQTILTPDKRRIMIGWLQNWDTANMKDMTYKWYGQMSIPREIHIKDGHLYQWPSREVDAMRAHEVVYEKQLVKEEVQLPGVSGRMVDLELVISPAADGPMYEKFTIKLAMNEKYKTTLSYHVHDSILKIDRKFSGSRQAVIHQRRCEVVTEHPEVLKLRIVMDRYSVEVFINDGIQTMSATLYTEQTAQEISFTADETLQMNLKKYDLK